jgi:AraC-like DNA-binding protein
MTQDAKGLKYQESWGFISANRRIRVSVIADEVGISEATLLKILHEDLGMNNISALILPFW